METLGLKSKLMLNCDASPDRPLLRICEEDSSTYGGTRASLNPGGSLGLWPSLHVKGRFLQLCCQKALLEMSCTCCRASTDKGSATCIVCTVPSSSAVAERENSRLHRYLRGRGASSYRQRPGV